MGIVWQKTEIPAELIDRCAESPGTLLKQSGCESRGEAEARDPKDIRLSFISPFIELMNSLPQIFNPALQRFQAMVTEFPTHGYLTLIETFHNNFQVFGN